jgi:rhamnosyltransferase
MEISAAVETVHQTPSSHIICAVIVTYFPDAQVVDRLKRITSQVAQTVVVDNGSSASCLEKIKEFSKRSAIHLVLNKSNEGLASALNAGVRWAIEQGYPWVLTLDQDTLIEPNIVELFAQAFRWYPCREKIAVIGSNYRDKTTGKVLWDVAAANESPAIEIPAVLTSGSAVSSSAFQAIGGFRDDFFIDCVDFEYCLRARAKGFHVLMTSKPAMEHGIGHRTQHRLFWRTFGTSNHSPVRQYFVARNTLILVRDYLRKETPWIHKHFWAWIRSIVRVLVFEKQRILKTKYIVKGFVDGLCGHTAWKPK